ncbi:Gamma-lactamase fdb1 [Aspergillus wentii]
MSIGASACAGGGSRGQLAVSLYPSSTPPNTGKHRLIYSHKWQLPGYPQPPVEIPKSQSTVDVYIIDTTSFMSGFPASSFVDPLVPGFDTMNAGSYAYLIRHPGSNTKYGTIMFDLGVRKDWENSPEAFVAGIKDSGGCISVDKDVATLLRERGQDLGEIGAIIWSHWHFDHAGDPQTFPTATDLIVGPGFKANIMPGFRALYEKVCVGNKGEDAQSTFFEVMLLEEGFGAP